MRTLASHLLHKLRDPPFPRSGLSSSSRWLGGWQGGKESLIHSLRYCVSNRIHSVCPQ